METLKLELFNVEQIESLTINGGQRSASVYQGLYVGIKLAWDVFTLPIKGAYEAGYDDGCNQ